MGDIFGFGGSSSSPTSSFVPNPEFLGYEPEELPGSEMDAPSELPTFSDYLQLYGSRALEGLGSAKKPKKQVFEGGRLFSTSYSGPRGSGSFRGVGQGVRPDEYLSAQQYEQLMKQRLEQALAEMVRDYKINPLV